MGNPTALSDTSPPHRTKTGRRRILPIEDDMNHAAGTYSGMVLPRVLAMMLVLAACSSGEEPIVFEPPDSTTSTSTTTEEPGELVEAIDEATGYEVGPIVEVLNAYNGALADGDFATAAGLLSHETIYFFDLVAALAEFGQPAEFDRSDFLAAVLAAVLRGWDGRAADGREAFVQLGNLGQLAPLPQTQHIEWLEVEPGVVFGLIDDLAFVTMRAEAGDWRVDLTQHLIRAGEGRRTAMESQTGLTATAAASEFIFEPFGFVEPEPPSEQTGGAMGVLPGTAWTTFVEAVEESDWDSVYNMIGPANPAGSDARLLDIDAIVAYALKADAAILAEIPFSDAVLALTLRAGSEPAAIEAMSGADVLAFAFESGLARLTTTETDLVWSTALGVRYLGLGSRDGAGVVRLGPAWFVDANVVVGLSATDLSSAGATAGTIDALLTAVEEITGMAVGSDLLVPSG